MNTSERDNLFPPSEGGLRGMTLVSDSVRGGDTQMNPKKGNNLFPPSKGEKKFASLLEEGLREVTLK